MGTLISPKFFLTLLLVHALPTDNFTRMHFKFNTFKIAHFDLRPRSNQNHSFFSTKSSPSLLLCPLTVLSPYHQPQTLQASLLFQRCPFTSSTSSSLTPTLETDPWTFSQELTQQPPDGSCILSLSLSYSRFFCTVSRLR